MAIAITDAMVAGVTLATLNNLVGGLGLFLLGMWLMTDGLKLAAGEALQSILERWTRTPLRAFGSGFLITGVVQSSSATVVATVGFVNAGLMALQQAVWVIVGSNAGTTITSWLVAIIGIKVDVGAFALLLVGVGMLLRLLAGRSMRRAGLGQAIAGFGAFFLGIGALQTAFGAISPGLAAIPVDDSGALAMIAFTFIGVMLTVLTQSSSAAMAIALTASATGSIPLPLAAATVIGTNIGTTSTALFAALNATPDARRVAAAHVAFNAWAAGLAFALLPVLLWISKAAARAIDGDGSMATVLAVFHTLFNFLGAVALWPLRERFVGWLSARFVSPPEDLGRPAHLDDTLLQVPAIAMRGIKREMQRLIPAGFATARDAISASGAAAAGLGVRIDALTRLSREVRRFMARLGSTRLPDDMTQTLASLIRATQHLDEALAAAAALSDVASPDEASWHPAMHELQKEALANLDLGKAGLLTHQQPDILDERAERLDAAYEQEKGRLLSAVAGGQMPVEVMEILLQRAQLVRRCGVQAIKAQRRLGAMDPVADEDEAQNTAV